MRPTNGEAGTKAERSPRPGKVKDRSTRASRHLRILGESEGDQQTPTHPRDGARRVAARLAAEPGYSELEAVCRRHRALDVREAALPGRALCVPRARHSQAQPALAMSAARRCGTTRWPRPSRSPRAAFARASSSRRVAASARLIRQRSLGTRRSGIANGFAIPMVAAGASCTAAVLDVAMPETPDARNGDSPSTQAFAENSLGVSAAHVRLEATMRSDLRDYQGAPDR